MYQEHEKYTRTVGPGTLIKGSLATLLIGLSPVAPVSALIVNEADLLEVEGPRGHGFLV